MNRYLTAFILTSFIYTAIFLAVFYTPQINKKVTLKKQEEKISFKIVKAKPKPKVIKKVEVEKIVKKETIKKVIKKKPKVKPKPKKVIKRKVLNKTYKKPKKIIKKVTLKKVEKQEKEVSIEPKKIQTTQIKQVNNIDLQQRFLKSIKTKINSNKYYPRIAKKRAIQGQVSVSFTLHKNGEISNIVTKGNKKYFEKSIKESLKKSFPISTINSNFQFPLTLNFIIKFILN